MVHTFRTPLGLAALATVALPGLNVVAARRAVAESADFESAEIRDAQGNSWIIRVPRHQAAGAGQEAEIELLAALQPRCEAGELPFLVSRPVGFVNLPEGGRAMVYPLPAGRPLRMQALTGGPGLGAQLGRAIAALHELPTSVVENAGMPVYSANAYRERHLAELVEAAKTGHVPPLLLQRWEDALEDVALWRFRPVVVHGDLAPEHVLTDGHQITALLNFSQAKVADPADDLAWLVGAASDPALDAVLEAYAMRRTERGDANLVERAQLVGELALARWLLFGVHHEDEEIVKDAVGMLEDLAAALGTADEQAEPEPPSTR